MARLNKQRLERFYKAKQMYTLTEDELPTRNYKIVASYINEITNKRLYICKQPPAPEELDIAFDAMDTEDRLEIQELLNNI